MAILAGAGITGTSEGVYSGGLTGVGRDYFNYGPDTLNVSQDGVLRSIDLVSEADNLIFKLKVFRVASPDWVFIAQTGEITITTAGTNLGVDLGVELNVLAGDVITIWHKASDPINGIALKTTAVTDPIRYSGVSSDYANNVAIATTSTKLPLTFMMAVRDDVAGTLESISTDTLDAHIQRIDNQIKVVVSGTYTGTPASIRRRVVYTDDNSIVSGFDWVTYIASPVGNAFTGAEIILPESVRQYRVELDFSNDALVTASTNGFITADKWLIYGQSLAKRLSLDGSTVTPNPLIKYADPITGVLSTPTVGDGAVTYLNSLAVESGFTQIAVNPAFNNMSLLEVNGNPVGNFLWDPLDTDTVRYLEVKAALAAVGGAIAGAIYVQGEADAFYGLALETYSAELAAHFAQLRQDTRAALPILIGVLGRSTYVSSDENWDIVQQSHIAVANTDANIFDTVKHDLALQDAAHLADLSNIPFGQRLANSAITNIFGGSADWQAPTISSIEVVTTTSTRINITQGQGTDFTPISNITGIELTEAGDGYNVSGISSVREAATSILVTHDAANITAGRVYYGKSPVITGIMLDNSTLKLPLTPATIAIAVSVVSTFNLSATGAPDGTYLTKFYDDVLDVLIEEKNITFSGGNASTTLEVAAGNAVHSLEKGNNPPTTGMAYVGVTE